MQSGVGNEELGIGMFMTDCRARHEDGNTHSAEICAVCGQYGWGWFIGGFSTFIYLWGLYHSP